MRRKTLLLLVFVLTSFFGFSNAVEVGDAATVAKNFMYERVNQYGDGAAYNDLQVAEWWQTGDAYYVFNFGQGWVIISQRSERTPVIGYNFAGAFPRPEAQTDNVQSWMQSFADEAQFIVENNVEASDEAAGQWHYYLNTSPENLDTEKRRDVATPMLTNMWNQDFPYNIYCPVDPAGPGGYVYVGCVATAMSQVMHYWRYPLQGNGQHQYFASPYGMQYANFGETTYNWDAMRDVVEYTHPYDVALIGYHAAVSVNMQFAPDGSGAFSHQVPGALINRFLYSNQTQYLQKQHYPNATWETMMQQQLDLGQVLYYSGYSSSGGHAFTCDGYQGMNYYHFNFGWGGSSNGWFNLQDVGGFNSGQGMVRNIVPNDTDYPYIAEGQTVLEARSGSFTDGSGPVQNYPAGMDASWLISPQSEVDSVVSIYLNFRKFNTAESDVVRVYSGETTDDDLLAEYAGDALPTDLVIQNNKALVTFSSTSSAPGFVAEYLSTAPVWCTGTTFINEPFGTIEDGSGPYNYNNATTCLRIIQVPEATTYTLTFNRFSTEEGKDILRVIKGNNQTVATLSGNSIPDPITVETNMVVLAWSTNAVIRDEGWELYYETDVTSVKEQSMFEHFSLFPNPANDQLQVNLGGANAQQVQFSLFTMSGQQVKTIREFVPAGNQTYSISLEGLAPGVYHLRLTGETGTMTRRVVVR